MTGQLFELARPFPQSAIQSKPRGGRQIEFVDHGTVTQRLLQVVGPFDWHVEPVFGPDGMLAAVAGTLRVTVDGRSVSVTEFGESDEATPAGVPQFKAAASDALKRCAMRLGLGLHLWVSSYWLDKALAGGEVAGEVDG